jgi:zinc transport system ATP-binding protein
MTLLTANKIALKYEDHYVFKDLSFSLNAGDFLCIVGPNGCGKSTLLKCLIGQIKLSSGKLTFNKNFHQNQIGYMPQNPKFNDTFPASVYEIVASGSLNRTKLFESYPKERIDAAMKALNIQKLAKSKFSKLSGGQRQKVLLARAIVASEELLILDEPSNNLDYHSKQEFYETLKKLNEKLTIIMVTHDLDHHNLAGNKILSLDPEHAFFGDTAEYVRRIHAH